MGKHASQRVKTDGPYRLSFVDEFTGDQAAEDFGCAYENVAAARQAAETTWAETGNMGDGNDASDIEWDGAIGTCSYKVSMGGNSAVSEFTCQFIVTRH